MKTTIPRFAKRLAWCGSLMLATASAFSQIAGWQFSSAAGTESTYAATSQDPNLAPGVTLGRGSGIGIPSSPPVRAYSASNWDASSQAAAITNNEYFQFSVQASAGYQTSLTSLDARLRRTSTGPNAYIWRYSLDGTTFTDIGSAVSFTSTADGVAQPTIDLSGISALQAVPAAVTITFRLYAWGATGSTGTLAIGRYGSGITTNSLALGGSVTMGSGPSNTSIEFQNTSGTVAENAGTTSLTVAITNPSTVNATSVDVVLTGGNAARIGNYTTQTVTFPPDDGNQVAVAFVNITITDNADCDADEVLTFQLQNITGGQGTPFIGGNDTYTLTVVNNETPADPNATAATGVSENGFTANWDAVAGATGYFLDVSTNPDFGIYTPVTVNEGFDGGRSSLPTGWSQTALGTDYTSTGNYGVSSPSLKFDDTNDQLVSTTYPGPATSVSFWYKGNSISGASALLVEGFNGSSWSTIGNLTPIANAANTKTYSLNEGDGYVKFRFTYSKDNGNLAFDDFSVTYTSGTPIYVPGYENLAVSGTSQAVTGLDPLTTYYYRVRSTGGCSTGANSNVQNTTTLAGVNPALSATSLSDFGNSCLNTASAAQMFTVSGANLTNANVTVGPLAGFSFSTTELGTYTTSLSISQPGGSFSQDVWVKFTPTAEQSYDGDIPIGGGGASSIDVTVAGSGINTAATISTGASSNIGPDQAEAAGTLDDAGCSALSSYGIEYSTTSGFTPGTGTPVPSSNLAGNLFSSVISGLSPCTGYYYVAYGTNNGGTSYGTEQSFTTGPIDAPVATAATGILQDGFTANWNAVPGATGYRLDVSTYSTFGIAVPASDLFFSEYVEGSGNNKYVEIFNGTGAPVNLANYALQLYSNGGNSPVASDTLSGTLADGAVIVYANNNAVVYPGTVTVVDAVNFNGDDAFALRNVVSGSLVDLIGTIGEDPGSAWTGAGGRSTANKTLVRNDNVHGGVTSNPATGFPTLVSEWAVYNQDDVSHLGAHSFDMMVPNLLPNYDDLAVAGTSQAVTGLSNSTTYYYRVRAESASCVSGNSNTISVTTLACAGNSITVAIHTDANGDQITWEIVDENNLSIATGGPYTGQNNVLVTDNVCLGSTPVAACYGFHLYDSFGDGLSGVGRWELRTLDGKVLLADDFATGYSSPSFTPASPGYGSNHSFCLPLGPANILASECGIFNNEPGNKVYCNKVTGATQYQFEFSDPDAGFIRRIVRTTNYVHFWDMVANPLVPGVHYFARVRTNVAGPVASAHWGSGCDMGLVPTVPCSQLIEAPAYGHSCNETRAFNPPTNNSFIYAKPVVGASQYQFRIFNSGEGYDQTFTRSTYILQLKWNNSVAPMLVNGSTYNVEINVNIGGVWSGFCPSSCTITIDNSSNFASLEQTRFGEASMWPNPVRDGQVNLSLGSLKDAQQQISVDVQDLFGKQVFTQQFGNSGERFSTILQLPSDLASGVYLVNITVNGKRTVQRLSIVR
jgi:hypothetical protein